MPAGRRRRRSGAETRRVACYRPGLGTGGVVDLPTIKPCLNCR